MLYIEQSYKQLFNLVCFLGATSLIRSSKINVAILHDSDVYETVSTGKCYNTPNVQAYVIYCPHAKEKEIQYTEIDPQCASQFSRSLIGQYRILDDEHDDDKHVNGARLHL
jgi:hypothetical protein